MIDKGKQFYASCYRGNRVTPQIQFSEEMRIEKTEKQLWLLGSVTQISLAET
jgi:hypothetical protein